MSNEFEVKAGPYNNLVARLDQKHNYPELSELTGHKKGLEDYGTARFELVRKSLNADGTVGTNISLGHFYLSPMPGCCGIVIVHGMYLHADARNSFLSNSIRELKTELCKALGYTVMMATTRMDEIPAVGNFFKSKYKFVDTFMNKRTDHLVGIGMKKI